MRVDACSPSSAAHLPAAQAPIYQRGQCALTCMSQVSSWLLPSCLTGQSYVGQVKAEVSMHRPATRLGELRRRPGWPDMLM